MTHKLPISAQSRRRRRKISPLWNGIIAASVDEREKNGRASGIEMPCTTPIPVSGFNAQSAMDQYSVKKSFPTCSIISMLMNLSNAPAHSGLSLHSRKSMQYTVIRSETLACSIRSRASSHWFDDSVTVSTVQPKFFAAKIAREPQPVPNFNRSDVPL